MIKDGDIELTMLGSTENMLGSTENILDYGTLPPSPSKCQWSKLRNDELHLATGNIIYYY